MYSTMERSAEAVLGGGMGGFGGGSGWQFMKTRGFLTWGFLTWDFAISEFWGLSCSFSFLGGGRGVLNSDFEEESS